VVMQPRTQVLGRRPIHARAPALRSTRLSGRRPVAALFARGFRLHSDTITRRPLTGLAAVIAFQRTLQGVSFRPTERGQISGLAEKSRGEARIRHPLPSRGSA
jgi:hypothetical protein